MKRLSLLSVLLFSSAVSMAQKSVVSDEHYTMLNIVPLRLDDEGVSASDALELYNKAGIRYPLYSLTLHPEGKPAMAKVERAVESYRRS